MNEGFRSATSRRRPKRVGATVAACSLTMVLSAGACAVDDPLSSEDAVDPADHGSPELDGASPAQQASPGDEPSVTSPSDLASVRAGLRCIGQAADEAAAAPTVPVPSLTAWAGPAVFDLELVLDGATRAVELVAQPGTGRLFAVGRDGVINEIRDGSLVEPAFLDIEGQVLSQVDAADGDSEPPAGSGVELLSSEQGLLSLAFHPDHEANGLLYTFHSRFGDGHSVVTEWRTQHDGAADPGSARTVIVFEQRPTAPVHKGGQLRFGPEGLLYIAVGDGGGAGDPFCHGRNPHTTLGTIVRIDPQAPSDASAAYTAPTGNPFAFGVYGHPGVWAWGLRNPWRFTIDGDLMIIADVGWDSREEINAARLGVDAGADFGWSAFEAEICIRAEYCDEAVTAPAVYYGHDEGAAVIGGHVYRGAAIAELTGRYLYADFTGGWIRSVTFDSDARAGEHIDWTSQLSDPAVLNGVYGFGADADGELYIVSNWGRTVYKIVPADG